AEQTRWAAVRAALAAQAQSPDPTRSFQALFTALPAKARVESLKCENGMLQATVRVDSLQAAARLVRRLQESADLADVVVSGVSAGGSAGGGTLVTFTARVPQTAAAGVVRSATSQIASGG
ncbi:MAG: hypothetical protein IRZ33_04545, partial [Alicyclobacillaceae bacterium]|nr:hypothetical protein [Alicyclobacillaceae bacterium]